MALSIRSGKEALTEKRYEDALHYFDEALQCVGASCRVSQAQKLPSWNEIDVLGTLDLKCSTLVKLERLDAAMETAKAMIRLNKTNARGYCRAASIENLRGDLLLAVKYLQHGKTRVLATDSLHEHLDTQYTKLSESLSKSVVQQKPIDPMTILPLELLQMVLSHLEYSEIVTMLQVSKNWRRILCKLEPLVTTVDFRASRKQINQTMLKAAMDRLQRPKTIAIYKFAPLAAATISHKLNQGRRFASLEHLSIDSPKIVLTSLCWGQYSLRSIFLGLDTSISINSVFEILSACQSLSKAVFRRVNNQDKPTGTLTRCENLQILELGNAFDLAAFGIPSMCFANYPNLIALTVNGAAYSMTSGESWDLRGNQKLRKLDTYASVIRRVQLPSSLEQWLWDGTEVRQFINRLKTIPEPLPSLHTLCLSGDNTEAALEYLHRSEVSSNQLHRVGLHNRQGEDLLLADKPHFRILSGVRELSFESENLQDRHFDAFVARFPDLETLQLAAPRITGAFIADLLKRPDNRLRKLSLKDCRNVSVDTVSWARGRGVIVEVHLGRVEVRGGRRLREGWF